MTLLTQHGSQRAHGHTAHPDQMNPHTLHSAPPARKMAGSATGHCIQSQRDVFGKQIPPAVKNRLSAHQLTQQ
jgi:hypothetical protein